MVCGKETHTLNPRMLDDKSRRNGCLGFGLATLFFLEFVCTWVFIGAHSSLGRLLDSVLLILNAATERLRCISSYDCLFQIGWYDAGGSIFVDLEVGVPFVMVNLNSLPRDMNSG